MERNDTGVLIGKQKCTEISSLVCTVKSQLNKQSRLRGQGNIKGSKVFKKREVGDQRYLAAEDQNHVGLDLATDDWKGSARQTSSMAKEKFLIKKNQRFISNQRLFSMNVQYGYSMINIFIRH